MTNKEKAREIAGGLNFPISGYESGEYDGALEMAKWKDHQFKEHLEQKKEEYMSQRDNANMWSEQWAVFHALTCTMHEIINELFKEEQI